MYQSSFIRCLWKLARFDWSQTKHNIDFYFNGNKKKFINIKEPGDRIKYFINVKDEIEAYLLCTNIEMGNNHEIFNIS